MSTLAGAGDLPPGPDVLTARAGDREQGAEVVLQARVTDGRVAELRYRVFGCPHLLAAASWLTGRLQGLDRDALLAWDWREVSTALEVPPAKFGRMLVLQDAVRSLARNWPGSGQSTV
jgi:NifU-like protein involved in Fe-S cluster formation